MKIRTILLTFALLIISIASAQAATNVTLLYGDNGSNWALLKTESDGTLKTDMDLTEHDSNIIPAITSIYDIGSSALKWFKGYFVNLYVSEDAYFATSSGNVGINTTTPQNKLNVIGDGNFTNNLTVDETTFFVDSVNDRVGIGTTNPTSRLHINGSGDQAMIFQSVDAGTYFTFKPGVNFAGVSIIICTSWSPVRPVRISGRPWLFILKILPYWVPSGILNCLVPFKLGTSIVAPKAA